MLAELDAGLKLVGQKRLPGLPLGAAFADIAVIKNDQLGQPLRLGEIPAELAAVFDPLWKQGNDDPLLVRVCMRFGSQDAQAHALSVSADPNADSQLRLAMLENLEELGDKSSIESVFEILASETDPSVRLASLDVLRRFGDRRMAEQLLAMYQELDDPIRSRVRTVLLGRPESALLFLQQVDHGDILATDVAVNELRRLAIHSDGQIDALVQKHWGSIRAGTPEEKLAEIRRLSNDLRADKGDERRGRALFTKHCATCHRLFDDGQAVGPELTTANRSDLTFLLTSIVDPSAQVRKEYMRYNVLTTDGRIATGLLFEDTEFAVTLLNEKNERVTIARDEIERLEPSRLSLMPEDILKPLEPQQVRDLFSYLQSQLNGQSENES